MADDDSGSDFDPRFGNWPAPPGTATSFGTPSSGQLGGQPLDEWVKNVTPDELARYTQDPDKQVAAWHARGIEVPDAEHIHAANDQFGTPSRPQRLDQGPASPLEGPFRVNPATGKFYNLTSEMNQPPAQGTEGLVMTDKRPSTKEDTGPGQDVAKALQRSWQGGPPKPYNRPGSQVPRESAPPGTPAELPHYPPGGSLDPTSGAFIGPQPPGGPPESVPPAPTSAAPPAGNTEVGGGKNDKGGTNKQSIAEKIEKNADITTEEGRKNVSDAVGTLGKAMQGVKAPEPLRPPQIGAPAAPHPLAANAPTLAGLLGLAGGGRPTPPILRLLGR